MLDFLASLAFYGTLIAYLLVGVVLLLSGFWIVDAIIVNRRANQWAKRLLSTPISSSLAPWGRKFRR